MTTHPSSVAHRFAEAFNTREVEQVVRVFTDDARYHDLFYGTADGHAGLRALFGRMYAEGRQHHWEMTTVVVGERATIGEWRFTFTVSDAVPHGAGRTLRFTGVSVFETWGDLCHTYREHFDRAAALLAVGIAPTAVAGIVRRRPSIEVAAAGSAMLAP
jgi:hypothetical protein